MDSHHWKKIKQHFEQIIELPLEQQIAALDALDEPLLVKSEVKKLLDAEAAQGNQPGLRTLVLKNAHQLLNSQLELAAGDRIGRYLITEVIGEGGMGVVYKACRDDEQFEHQVAIKLSRQKLTYSNVLQQHYEQNILAQLKHPHIAHIYDAGTTADDHAFIVMELIEGVDLITYANENRLSISKRLQLFIKVANTIQYAHQKGIVHRDIKPQNILITQVNGQGEPKIIDFGIAEHFQLSDPGEVKNARSPQAILGTPAYMSPEQLQGDEKADVRSDIYALGLLLCELMTGSQPFAREGLTLDELLRQKQSDTFAFAGSVLAAEALLAVADERRLTAKRFKAQLNHEFEALILKATELDPDLRYASVEAFVGDIERWQNNYPLLAVPGDRRYFFKKYLQRNRWPVAISLSVFLSLVSAAAISSWSLYKESQALQLAENELAKSNAINRFITDILASADPRKGSMNLKVVDLLDRAEEKLDDFNHNEQDIKASLLFTLGRSRSGLGQREKALENLNQAITIKSQYLERSALEMIRLYTELGEVTRHTNPDKALEIFTENLSIAQMHLGPGHTETLSLINNVATRKFVKGRKNKDKTLMASAIKDMKALLALREQVLGLKHPETSHSRNNLATFYQGIGDLQSGLSLYLKNLAIQKEVFGIENYYTLGTMRSIALTYMRTKNFDKAESVLRPCFEGFMKIQAADAYTTLEAGIMLIESLLFSGKTEEAKGYALRMKSAYLDGKLKESNIYMEQVSIDLFAELFGAPVLLQG
ncbi:serine/threonine-protein kinase [Thalassomonas actiniarum]|uniref:Serine/threonine protein kinase n=1 Tax=Thalassomonas actiniarum TaxID=485447 RepID=A0AAF0C6T0_9GAMM|nr:serine/threonine-protein kinase [Thalassomonas actiniarum]WDE02626.1 serine/threonine protein kinase [Thalassomonas actiniarum]